MDVFFHFGSLLWPVVVGLLLLAMAWLVQSKTLEKSPLVKVVVASLHVVFHYVELSPFKEIISRTLFAVIGLVVLLYPAFRDYSVFFPSRYTINVYFDADGLATTLNEFSKNDLRKLNMEPDWRGAREKHFLGLNKDLLDRGYNFQFLLQRGMTVGRGIGHINLKKISWSSQRYKIIDAKGSLTFETPSAGEADVRTLDTRYELIETDAAYISENGFSVYYPHSIIARPDFRQFAHLSRTSHLFSHNLTAATKMFVPLFEIEQTVYFVSGEGGRNIPIGYAILSPI